MLSVFRPVFILYFLRRLLMKQIYYWKAVTLVAILILFLVLQPAIAYACSSGSHCGG